MIDSIKTIWKNDSIRKKIIAVLLLTLVYKFLSVIPIPGSNPGAMEFVMGNNSGLAFIGALMGGGMESFSIILMGLAPYINAVIILQLLGVVIPRLGELQKEGEQGQKIITKWTRWLTLPLAFVQSYGMIFMLNSLAQVGGAQIIDLTNYSTVLMAMCIATAGTMFLMWLGEIMTEYGIGNGISILITAGVLAGSPQIINGYLIAESYGILFGIIVATLVIIYIIIKFTEGNRRIPVIYSRTGRDEKSYFPIRVNQAGMIPIIFAVSIVTFPSIIGQVLTTQNNPRLKGIGDFMVEHLSMDSPDWPILVIYFLLVVGFTFFYVSITFNTDDVAENIQKRGGYIPGIRPGADTSKYLRKVSNYLNVYGGSFLALIAVLPYAIGAIFFAGGTFSFIIDGAGLIIVVSVILDIVRTVDSEMKMYDYSRYK